MVGSPGPPPADLEPIHICPFWPRRNGRVSVVRTDHLGSRPFRPKCAAPTVTGRSRSEGSATAVAEVYTDAESANTSRCTREPTRSLRRRVRARGDLRLPPVGLRPDLLRLPVR